MACQAEILTGTAGGNTCGGSRLDGILKVLAEVITGGGVGGEGLWESGLDVYQVRADVGGGAELGCHAVSLPPSLLCLTGLWLRPVTRDWVGGDQHCPLWWSHSSANYPLTANSSHRLSTGPGPAQLFVRILPVHHTAYSLVHHRSHKYVLYLTLPSGGAPLLTVSPQCWEINYININISWLSLPLNIVNYIHLSCPIHML